MSVAARWRNATLLRADTQPFVSPVQIFRILQTTLWCFHLRWSFIAGVLIASDTAPLSTQTSFDANPNNVGLNGKDQPEISLAAADNLENETGGAYVHNFKRDKVMNRERGVFIYFSMAMTSSGMRCISV